MQVYGNLDETDNPIEDWQIPENQNRKVLSHLRWIISTPIILQGVLVGVLNADFSCAPAGPEVLAALEKYFGDMAATFSGII